MKTELEVAIDKLDKEAKKLKVTGMLQDWTDMIAEMAAEDIGIRQGIAANNLADVLGAVLKESFNKKEQVDKSIVKAAGLEDPIYIGIPSRREVKEIIRKAYGVAP